MDIQLPPDLESHLSQLAASGTDVQVFVAQSIREGILRNGTQQHTLDEPATEAEVPSDDNMSEADWQAGFKDWVESFPKRKTMMDDSRESIYEGRGE